MSKPAGESAETTVPANYQNETAFWTITLPGDGSWGPEFNNFEGSAAFLRNQDDFLAFKDCSKIYCAPSVGLVPFKKNILESRSNQQVDLGLDPYGLGLWQSQLHKLVPFDKIEIEPGVRVYRLSLQAYAMAGASYDQLVAIALASLEQLVEDLAGQYSKEEVMALTSVEVPLGPHLFDSLAFLSLLQKEIVGFSGEGAQPALYAVPAASELATREPWNNMLRLVSANSAAHMGSVQGFVALPFDLFSRGEQARLSRNIDLVLQLESFLGKVNRPAAGSTALQEKVVALDASARELHQEIVNKGGLVAVLQAGWLQGQIAEEQKRKYTAIDQLERRLTGVNHHPTLVSPSEEFPLVNIADRIDIESWWESYQCEEERQKRCDIQRLIPKQDSWLFEQWQFRADQLRELGTDKVSCVVEEGANNKFAAVRSFFQLGGLDLIEADSLAGQTLGVVLAGAPDSDWVEKQKKLVDPDSLLIWGGDRASGEFTLAFGDRQNPAQFFEKVFAKLEVKNG